MGGGASIALSSESDLLLKDLSESWNDLTSYQVSKLLNYIDRRLTVALEQKCPMPLNVTVLYAIGLLDKDFILKSDPYVRVRLNNNETNQEFKTKSVNNTTSPAWNETFTFTPGAVIGSELVFELWDKDCITKDDSLGHVSVKITSNAFRGGFGPYQMLVQDGKGSLVFQYSLKPHYLPISSAGNFIELRERCERSLEILMKYDLEEAGLIQQDILDYVQKLDKEIIANRVVVRKEVRRMSEVECERFYNAVTKMMENVNDEPETSEFFRLASYHGWPHNYCVHRQESFPTWHRAYMVSLFFIIPSAVSISIQIEFERSLQAADVSLGGDGKLGLPYWDFGTYEINGQVLPNVARKFEELPEKFFFEENRQRMKSPFYRLHTEKAVLEKLEMSDMALRLQQCLEETNHWRHASNENGSGISLENPHNQAHVACGYPVSSVSIASYHPVFYLIHANVDRYYQKYLQLEPDSCEEFREHQKMRTETGAPDKFSEGLEPFIMNHEEGNPWQSETVMCSDIAKSLNYVYDELPQRDPPQMRESPVWAVFNQVDVVNKLVGDDGNMLSFELHIFVLEKARAAEWVAPKTVEEFQCGEYGGWCSAFPGKGPKCSNCQITSKIMLSKDITKALNRLNVSREDACLSVLCVDEFGAICPLEELSNQYGKGVEIPIPKIVGSYFEGDFNEVLTRDVENVVGGYNITQLSKCLKKYGFYLGDVCDCFTEELEDAVKEFQSFFGFINDGKVGPIMKTAILAPRNDVFEDLNTCEDEKKFEQGSVVKWFLGSSPGKGH